MQKRCKYKKVRRKPFDPRKTTAYFLYNTRSETHIATEFKLPMATLCPKAHAAAAATTTTTTGYSITNSFLPKTTPLFHYRPSLNIAKLLLQIRCSLPNGRRRPEYIPNHISDPNYVRVLDTTLRDGEQAPGATMTASQKLDIARMLAKLGVDIIEAGFPAASDGEFETVKLIAKEVGNGNNDEDGHVPVICGMARCKKRDIDKCWEGVKYAKKPRILTFIATSEIHMKYKLKKTKEEVVETARNMVAYARSLCSDVGFAPEDAGRFE